MTRLKDLSEYVDYWITTSSKWPADSEPKEDYAYWVGFMQAMKKIKNKLSEKNE